MKFIIQVNKINYMQDTIKIIRFSWEYTLEYRKNKIIPSLVLLEMLSI